MSHRSGNRANRWSRIGSPEKAARILLRLSITAMNFNLAHVVLTWANAPTSNCCPWQSPPCAKFLIGV